jgi:tRNA threonylcarbamoyladenosine biosynthesis protein TsaB
MRILALDTATEACSVALLSHFGSMPAEGDILGRYEELGKSHAQQILGMVEAVLAEAQTPLASLDGIAASIGPGSFTGVRISVAVAQGLAFGANLPIVPVTTLEALALQAVRSGAGCALACLDARMNEVYWGCFAADSGRGVAPIGAAAVGPPDSVFLPEGRACRGIGRGFDAYPRLATLPGLELDPNNSRTLPDARDFARLGALRFALGEACDAAEVRPLYLRDKVALTEAERRSPPPLTGH